MPPYGDVDCSLPLGHMFFIHRSVGAGVTVYRGQTKCDSKISMNGSTAVVKKLSYCMGVFGLSDFVFVV